MATQPIPPWEPWKTPRKCPRVALLTEVECLASGVIIHGWSENVSTGGLFVLSSQTFEPDTRVIVRLKFPSGYPLECPGCVARAIRGKHMGIQFLELKEEDRKALTDYINKAKHPRRSARIARHVSVVIRWTDPGGNAREEPAQTIDLSRYGCRLACQTRFKVGENLYLWWPEGQRGVHTRAVFRRLGGLGEATEVAVEFLDDGDFWRINFPLDMPTKKR